MKLQSVCPQLCHVNDCIIALEVSDWLEGVTKSYSLTKWMAVQRSKWKLITGPVSVSRPVLWESKEALIMIITSKQDLSGSTSASRCSSVVVVVAAVLLAWLLLLLSLFLSFHLLFDWHQCAFAPPEACNYSIHGKSVQNYIPGNWLHRDKITWTVQMCNFEHGYHRWDLRSCHDRSQSSFKESHRLATLCASQWSNLLHDVWVEKHTSRVKKDYPTDLSFSLSLSLSLSLSVQGTSE